MARFELRCFSVVLFSVISASLPTPVGLIAELFNELKFCALFLEFYMRKPPF